MLYDIYGFSKYRWQLKITASKFCTAITGCPKFFRVTFGCCNLGFPYRILESTGIIQRCYAFAFLVSWGSIPGWKSPPTRSFVILVLYCVAVIDRVGVDGEATIMICLPISLVTSWGGLFQHLINCAVSSQAIVMISYVRKAAGLQAG